MAESNHTYDISEHEPLPEGEEAPPPFVHTMAIIRWVILGGMSLFALIMVLSALGLHPWAADQNTAVQYHCPMHPTYISNQPGECPICGMSLVPIKGGAEQGAAAESVHTEHKQMEHAAAEPGQYTCPMHLEVISDKPGECPKCGMDLVKVEVSETEHAGHDMAAMGHEPEPTPHDMTAMGGVAEQVPPDTTGMGSHPVSGLVPVTIEPQRLQLIGVRTAKAERRPLGESLRLVGFVTPDESRVSNLHVRVNGWVSQLFVDQTGQFVKAGEPLMLLYSPDLYQAKEDFLLVRDAVAGPTPDSILAATRRQLLQAARERLRLLGLPPDEISQLATSDLASPELALRSPFSGYVLEKNVNQGQYVGPDQNLLTIVDLSSVWVLADVYEQDASGVHVGQAAHMQLAALPDEEFDGRIEFIYPTVSERTRTLRVRLRFPNPSLRLRPGMYADVTVSQDGEAVLAVPTGAVMDGGETQYAFVVHDRVHFEPRLLKLGQRSSDDWVEVLSGLAEGEDVVTSANFLIDSESRLKAAVAGMGGAQAGGHEGHAK